MADDRCGHLIFYNHGHGPGALGVPGTVVDIDGVTGGLTVWSPEVEGPVLVERALVRDCRAAVAVVGWNLLPLCQADLV